MVDERVPVVLVVLWPQWLAERRLPLEPLLVVLHLL
jgi:hypothetical protein